MLESASQLTTEVLLLPEYLGRYLEHHRVYARMTRLRKRKQRKRGSDASMSLVKLVASGLQLALPANESCWVCQASSGIRDWVSSSA